MANSVPRRTARSEEASEASHLNPPNERDFSIPRKPVSSSSAQSGNIDRPMNTDNIKYESLDVPREKEPARAQRVPRWLHGWWLEVLSCILFIGALMAIVGTILPYQDRPLPQWPYHISINTLISILIAVAKSAMLLVVAEGLSQLKWTWFRRKQPLQDMAIYDMASRGPWGSLRLLSSIRGRDLLASVGAVVTVASIAIDPFAQQVVRYAPCTIWTPSPQASLPRTNSYSERCAQIFAGIGVVPAAVQASINAGVFTPGAMNVSFNCPTGNCTFGQEYHTLAYCSSCVDSTPNLTVAITNTSNSLKGYNYSLPSGLYSYASEGRQLQSYGNLTLFVMQASESSGLIEMIINPWPDQASLYQQDYTAECLASRNQSFGCNGIGAATCSLFPCIKTHTGDVQSGYLSEQVVSNWTRLDFGEFDQVAGAYALDVDCLDQASRKAVVAQGHPVGPDTHWLAYNTTLDQTVLPDGSTTVSPIIAQVLSGPCMYTFSEYTLSSLAYFWTSYFDGNVTEPEAAQDFPAGSSGVVQAIYDTILNNTGLIFANQTGQFQNLSRIFDSIADSLTVHIRQNGDSNHSLPVTGAIGRENTCVHVYWQWLAFPFTLVLMTILFLAVLLFQTGREQDPFHGWKSSPLGLLYHGLDHDTLVSHGQGNDVAEMVDDAKALHVRLGRTDQGWKLTNS